jgi:hypothetical protein
MALDRREVLKTNTFEEQRLEINRLAQDLYDVSRGDLGIEALQLDGPIIDSTDSEGKPGQFLKCTGTGVLWKTLSISNVLWVTKDGNDTNDGLSQETAKASIKSALRAANSGYLGKLQDASNQILVNKKLIQQESIGWLLTEYLIQGNGDRQIDAANLIDKNKNLIANEAVERMLLNQPSFVIPGGNQKCVSDLIKVIDAIIFNLRFDGNNKVYEAANVYASNPALLDGEVEQSRTVYEFARALTISAMRNEPIVIQGSHGYTQFIDNTVIGDQSNQPGVYNFTTDCADIASAIVNFYAIILQAIGTEAEPGDLDGITKTQPERFTFPNSPPESGRYKDARNLIYRNIDEIADRALAEIAIEYDEATWGNNWTFPGASLTAETQRYKDAYRLIQKNRDYIIDEAVNSIIVNFPSFINPDELKCRRDLGYFIDAVSLDIFMGGNKYSRKFASFYYSGASVQYLDGEVSQSVLAFNSAKDLMIDAMRNLLPYKDLTITIDTNPDGVCVNVEQSLISLANIITDVLANGIDDLADYPETSGTLFTNESKCRRDIEFVARCVAEDLYNGGNTNIIRAARKYFNIDGELILIDGEQLQSKIAFAKAGQLINKAITNQLYEKNLTLPEAQAEYGGTGDIITYGVSGNGDTCIDVQNTVTTLITILTTVLDDETLVSLNSIVENEGIWAEYENICLRDIGYIVEAVASDLKQGGNVNCVDAGNAYYKGNELVFIDGEERQSLATFEKAKELMILAMRNWEINQAGTVYKPKYSFLDPYIDPTIIPDTILDEDDNEIPVYPACADVALAIENYFNIIEYIINNGENSVEQQLPSFKTTIFVKSGVYTEQNPMTLPPNTGIVGDNLREVTIFPATPTADVFYCNNGSYITGATFSGHLAPSVVGSFPKVRVGPAVNLPSCSGLDKQYKIIVPGTADLSVGMTVTGNGIGTGAIITKIIGAQVFLSVANRETFNNRTIKFENFVGLTGVITRSPYIQNCTSITTTGAGLRVDGNLAGGTASFVLDSYTQYNQGGDGIVITNGGYTQLVSIFEICCDRAVYLSGGSTCSITNSNTDFGNFGLVADGTSPLQYKANIDFNQLRGNTFKLKNLRTEPYVGQVITFGNNGNPYYFIQEINITNGGSGYDPNDPPGVIIDAPTGPDGITAQAIANIVDGKVDSITLISSGSQFVTPPNIQIVGGDPDVTAVAVAKMYPQYYSIIGTTDVDGGKSTITLDETVPFDLNDNDEVYFYQVTKIIANSHCFEYVGAGTQINKAIPAKGGVPAQEREVVELNGGKVAFTSTDHLGNFRIGQGIQINQNTGTLSGDSFERSLFVTVTPFILALS